MSASSPQVKVRRLQSKISPLRAGILALILIVVATYLAFSKQLPWEQPFEFKAVFQTSNNLRLDSPVRIAGVNVGKVTDVKREDGGQLVQVTMQMDDAGLPIHKDATAMIRSRIFLEGNFFVDLKPGTPQADTLDDGDSLSVAQTSTPVQLDELLTALQTDDREKLQQLLIGLGTGLSGKPSAASDADQDPSTRGDTAAESLNDSLTTAPKSLKTSAQVNQALLGTDPHDLSKLIKGLDKVVTALGTNEEQLKEFITNFNRFFAIFAAEQTSWRQTVHELGPTLEAANRSLTSLNAAIPQISGFARDIIPGIKETPATVTAMTPWIAQAQQFFGPNEGGPLLHSLQPAVQSLAVVVDQSFELFKQTELTSRCFSDVIIPGGNTVLQDGASTSGVPNYREFWYTMVGFAGEAGAFDGNGSYVRTATGGGDNLITTGKLSGRPASRSQLYGNALVPPQGTRPKKPSKAPPYNTSRDCYKNAPPNLNGPAAAAGPPDKLVKGTP
jgi:phospholipid/cholesterol/gamma-HCH transport system substrate-binding protein